MDKLIVELSVVTYDDKAQGTVIDMFDEFVGRLSETKYLDFNYSISSKLNTDSIPVHVKDKNYLKIIERQEAEITINNLFSRMLSTGTLEAASPELPGIKLRLVKDTTTLTHKKEIVESWETTKKYTFV